MLHALLFLGCVISIEIFLNLNFLNHLNKIISITRKVLLVMSNKEISDHWKENLLPRVSKLINRETIEVTRLIPLA